LDIIEAILRYRFSPTSELVRLVGGSEDVTLRRLRRLWERGLVNRWAFPGIRTHSEFHYYLDNRQTLDLLVERGRFRDLHTQMLEEVRNNREKDYAGAVVRGQHMQLGFLQHSLTVSRMHFMLEMACRTAGGGVELAAWRQGSQLAGNKVEMPKVRSRRQGNEYFWGETDEKQRLPLEPDALFTLRFNDRPEAPRLAHFFYEADRGTMVMADMLKKLRAYYHLIKRLQKHRESFGIHPVRAVLIETTGEARARRLMELARHPLVSGTSKRTSLFWFTISPLFADSVPTQEGRAAPALGRYLVQPTLVLDRIWALPDRRLQSLGDVNNTPASC
jgi:DNA-binding HxlR family transcriptional regulator